MIDGDEHPNVHVICIYKSNNLLGETKITDHKWTKIKLDISTNTHTHTHWNKTFNEGNPSLIAHQSIGNPWPFSIYDELNSHEMTLCMDEIRVENLMPNEIVNNILSIRECINYFVHSINKLNRILN